MNKKPTELRLIEGNRGNRPLPKNEPKPRPETPDTPKDIDLQAKKTWDRLAPVAERLGLLTEVDGDMFSALCQARSRLMQIWTRLKQIPSEIRKTKKQIKKLKTEQGRSPDDIDVLINELVNLKTDRAYWMKEERLYFNSFRMLANDFGFSPRGRVGLVVMGTDPGEGEDLLS